MNEAGMLASLKVDLGISATVYDTRLAQLIQVAKANIISEGAASLNTDNIDDANLVIQYAAWLWRRRDTMVAMPRMLRWQLNNRVFGEKMV